MRLCSKTALIATGVIAALAPCAFAATITDFAGDFQGPTPKTGWSYLWNAGGAMGTASNYTALNWDSGNNFYDITGLGFPAGAPGSYGIVASGFMHPPQGSEQSAFEHYSIAAYTLQNYAPGAAVTNLTVSDGDAGNGDGVHVWVSVNDNAPNLLSGFANGGSLGPTNVSLGNLSAGATIYVAIGSIKNDGNDSTIINFQIVPEPASLALFGLAGLTLLRRRRCN